MCKVHTVYISVDHHEKQHGVGILFSVLATARAVAGSECGASGDPSDLSPIIAGSNTSIYILKPARPVARNLVKLLRVTLRVPQSATCSPLAAARTIGHSSSNGSVTDIYTYVLFNYTFTILQSKIGFDTNSTK
ncbi:unnamed protein product [Colias eurytheme]|nr:unnamed protein product [Colias eurytheme]